MPFLDEIREELQEESNQQQADVHTVHIGIGCYNHFVVTQSFDSVFYIQGCLEQVTLRKTDAVKELLEFYMGKNTMERQNFIIDNLVIEEDLAS